MHALQRLDGLEFNDYQVFYNEIHFVAAGQPNALVRDGE